MVYKTQFVLAELGLRNKILYKFHLPIGIYINLNIFFVTMIHFNYKISFVLLLTLEFVVTVTGKI